MVRNSPISGGVDNAFILPRGDKKEVKNHMFPILEADKEGGIAIGTHFIGSDISVGTFDYYNCLIQQYGSYKINNC